MISLSGIENVISIAWVIYILFVNKVKLEIETSFWTLYVKDNFNRYTKNGNKHIYLHLLTYTTQVHAVKNSHLYVHQTADLQIPWGDILLAEPTCLLTDPPNLHTQSSVWCTVKGNPGNVSCWQTLSGPRQWDSLRKTEMASSYHQVLWASKNLKPSHKRTMREHERCAEVSCLLFISIYIYVYIYEKYIHIFNLGYFLSTSKYKNSYHH